MIEVLRVGLEIQDFMSERGWRFAFIGGVANLAWGSVRTTQDVDLTLFTSFINEKAYIDEILAQFAPRIADAARFALQARVVLLEGRGGIGIDIGLAGFPYEEHAINRRTLVDFGEGISLWLITAEDLVIMKAFAGRGQDWVDVEGIIRRQGKKLDWPYILEHAPDLAAAKEDDTMIDRLLEIRDRWP